MGFMDNLKRRKILKSIDKQIKTKEHERATAQSNAPLAPDTIAGYPKKYHYKDVDIGIVWQYGGHYGKTLKDIGTKRGDRLYLIPEPTEESDREVSVYRDDIKIGYMKRNRMADMVYQWSKSNLPIFAAINHLGKEHKAIIEVAFYGAPSKKAQNKPK